MQSLSTKELAEKRMPCYAERMRTRRQKKNFEFEDKCTHSMERAFLGLKTEWANKWSRLLASVFYCCYQRH
jgi:hypothetical protein